MEDKKVVQILTRCKEVANLSSLAIKCVINFVKDHPHIV